MKKITIIGGGNCSHVLIPLLGSQGHQISLLTSHPELWSHNITVKHILDDNSLGGVIQGSLYRSTSNPQEVIPEADIILLVLPVHLCRQMLAKIAPYIHNDQKKYYIGTLYGQGGFNWMCHEAFKSLNNITFFAIGMAPYIARWEKYGSIGNIYGWQKYNIVAVKPQADFEFLNTVFFSCLAEKVWQEGKFHLVANFLSLTLSADNQCIHPSRCYSLTQEFPDGWKNLSEVPMFYHDYDKFSANELYILDQEFNLVRNALRQKFPQQDFSYMMDYLALEQLTYQSDHQNILDSFCQSRELWNIKTPVIKCDDGQYRLDKNHRFFLDDIFYGVCIFKWFAQQLKLETPQINKILHWAEKQRNDKYLDENNILDEKSSSFQPNYKCGIPFIYGYKNISEIME